MKTANTIKKFRLRALGAASLAALAAIAPGPAGLAEPPQPPLRPNIILIMADDFGIENVGAHGGTPFKTPNLDRLAAEGMRFDHCFSQPLCTPTRVQLMTGKYNVRNYTKFGELDRNEKTFAHALKGAGYATCVVGKWQLGEEPDSPQHFGFDEACLWHHRKRTVRYANAHLAINGEVKAHPGKYGPDIVRDFAMDFITRHKDGPFFVYYPMILTHSPFEPTPDSEAWNPAAFPTDVEKGQGDRKCFADMVAYADKIVGQIDAHLAKLGIRENTILIFLGDNGTQGPQGLLHGKTIPGAKGSNLDGGTHVPLIVSWPGKIAPGSVGKGMVDTTDFLPTLCEAAGAPPPKEPIDGRSLLPQLLGKESEPRQWIYCWYARKGGGNRKSFEYARSMHHKLYADGKFYDLRSDPAEEKPLDTAALDSGSTGAFATLRGVLESFKDARPPELGIPAN